MSNVGIDWNNTNVLITGACGVIGKQLTKLLFDVGANILTIDVLKSPFPDIPHLQKDLRYLDRVKYDPETFWAISDFYPEYIFHLAAVFERTVERFGEYNRSFEYNVKVSHDLINELPLLIA